MKSFYINPSTGDLEFDGQNNFKMTQGDEELVQCVSLTLKTNQGEWFLNPEHGFDRSVVQTKKYNEVMVNDAVNEAVLQDDRVRNIDNVTFDYNKAKRHLSVDFSFYKKDGSLIGGGIE